MLSPFPLDLEIRFQNVTYSVDESDSSLVAVVTLEASLERDITLQFVTVDGRASAGMVSLEDVQ